MFYKRYLLIMLMFSASTTAETYKSQDFTIEYDGNIPFFVVERLAKSIGDNRKIILAYLNQSEQYKGTPIKEELVVYVSKQHPTPYQFRNTIHIPENRVLSFFSNDKAENKGLAIIHELTHIYAVSFHRQQKKNGYEDRFFDDGLAVFMQHRFGESSEYPNFGKDLYHAVAKVSTEYGGLIAFERTELVRKSSKRGIGRRLAYLQEGAFTQFLIENYGLDRFFRIYAGESAEDVVGKTLAELEDDWVKLIKLFSTLPDTYS